jgi:outer membrane protein OmpA-like peptidoglycan-associated protein
VYLPLTALALLGLLHPQVATPPIDGAVRVAGICVGSAQDCLKEAIADGELSAEEASLPYEVYVAFGHNSAELTQEAQDELRALATVLNEPVLKERRFSVEGHTDSKGDEAYNQALSERRAAAVSDFLGANVVDPSRLSSIGYGESKPRTSDPSAPENRRVELKIVP